MMKRHEVQSELALPPNAVCIGAWGSNGRAGSATPEYKALYDAVCSGSIECWHLVKPGSTRGKYYVIREQAQWYLEKVAADLASKPKPTSGSHLLVEDICRAFDQKLAAVFRRLDAIELAVLDVKTRPEAG